MQQQQQQQQQSPWSHDGERLRVIATEQDRTGSVYRPASTSTVQTPLSEQRNQKIQGPGVVGVDNKTGWCWEQRGGVLGSEPGGMLANSGLVWAANVCNTFLRFLGTADNNVLQEAPVPIIPHSTCTSRSYYGSYVNEFMVCAGYEEGGIDTCQVSRRLHRINSSPPGQSGRHFADDILKCILWMKSCIFWFKFHLSLLLMDQLIILQHWFR